MEYRYLSYHAEYVCKFIGEKNKIIETIDKVGAACFSSMYSYSSRLFNEDRNKIKKIDMTIYIDRTTKKLGNKKDNYCHLSDDDIKEFLDEIKKLYDIDVHMGFNKEKDMTYLHYVQENPTCYQAKYMPCLLRYLYEKDYHTLLCGVFAARKNGILEGYSIIQQLIMMHLFCVGGGHRAFACPKSVKTLVSDIQLTAIYRSKIGPADYLGLDKHHLNKGVEIKTVSFPKPNTVEEIDVKVLEMAEAIEASLHLEGFFA